MRLAPPVVSVLVVAGACSTDGTAVDTCTIDPVGTQLCVVVSGRAQTVHRLASIDVDDPTNNLEPDPSAPFERLTEVALAPREPLTLAIGPAEGLTLVEISVYSGISALDDLTPIAIAECDPDGCSRWSRSDLRDGWAIEVPADDLEVDNVIVASAFVAGPAQTGSISWGILVGERS